MANLFRSVAQGVVRSPFVIVITVVFVLLLIISLGLSYEDYQTTYHGYRLLPTAKVNDWIIPLVSLLPQVGQIAFMYTFATDTRRRWGLLIAFALHVFDVMTDVYFKAYGQGPLVWLVALVESEVLFTLGAEMALAFSLGMLFELAPHAIEQSSALLQSLLRAAGFTDDGEARPARRGVGGRDLE